MAFQAGLDRRWYVKGRVAGKGQKFADSVQAWHAAKGKPTVSGKRVTAQESFYQGYIDGKYQYIYNNPSKKVPKGWVKASAVKITKKGGKVTVQIRKRA